MRGERLEEALIGVLGRREERAGARDDDVADDQAGVAHPALPCGERVERIVGLSGAHGGLDQVVDHRVAIRHVAVLEHGAEPR